MTEEKIETQLKSFRLPIDVITILDRWSGETGQSVTACLTTVIRVAAEDEKRITKPALEGESVLQEAEVGVGVIQVRAPRGRDELADVLSSILDEASGRVGVNDRISALGVARARIYKTTPEYQAAKGLRDEGKLPPSPYEDEKALAERLSNGSGVKGFVGVREKGDKTR